MSEGRELTRKQRLFVEAYCGEARGNATEAARMAGYKGNAVTLANVAKENLRKRYIAEAIKQMDIENPSILNSSEIREMWTQIAKGEMDPEIKMADRLAALRDLARASAMFIDRVESKTTITFDDEAIRAELARRLPGYTRGR